VILDGEVAMLQAQVERLQEQLTESDHERIANIARLTGQVETMKRERDAARICFEIEREDRRKSDAQRDELQRLLTACEEERDAAREESKARLRSWNDEAEGLCDQMRTWVNKAKANEDRVRVLESENAHLKRECGRLHAAGAALFETYRHGMTRDESYRHMEALKIHMTAPAAETPAPTGECGHGRQTLVCEHPICVEMRSLRADLADTRAQLAKVRHDRDEMIRTFDEVEAQRDAANERIAFLEFSVTDRRRQKDEEMAAHAATKAQLARAMAILPDALLWVEAESINLSDAMPYEACIDEIKAILADADSKDTGEAWEQGQTAIELLSHAARPEWPTWEAARKALMAKVDARRGSGQ
jgi:DNA repair exonuclease SbcCD ATPase subunit